ncbi:MAG: MlaD family protein [Bacteroidetes bacterium]|nr:MlaD family protein [Bacteroidota bacterium]
MKKDKINEIKVGAVSIVGVLLLLLVLYFTKSFSFGEKNISVLFEFDNALGINTDAPVHINGVRKGIVNKIWLNKGRVFINASLEDISDLRDDCTAEIQILEITGGKKIEIIPGISANSFNPNNSIIGKESLDLGSAISKINDITSNFNKLIDKVDTLLCISISTIKDTNITRIISNTAEVTNTLNDIINDNRIDNMISNLASVSTELNKLLLDNKHQLSNIVNNFDTTSVEISKMMHKVQETIEITNVLLNKIHTFVDDIKENEGTFGKLIYDTTFANKMINTVDSLETLMEHIKKNGLNLNIKLFGK